MLGAASCKLWLGRIEFAAVHLGGIRRRLLQAAKYKVQTADFAMDSDSDISSSHRNRITFVAPELLTVDC